MQSCDIIAAHGAFIACANTARVRVIESRFPTRTKKTRKSNERHVQYGYIPAEFSQTLAWSDEPGPEPGTVALGECVTAGLNLGMPFTRR